MSLDIEVPSYLPLYALLKIFRFDFDMLTYESKIFSCIFIVSQVTVTLFALIDPSNKNWKKYWASPAIISLLI